MTRWRDRAPAVFFVASAILLAAGALAAATGADDVSRITWVAATLLGLALSLLWTVRSVTERRSTS